MTKLKKLLSLGVLLSLILCSLPSGVLAAETTAFDKNQGDSIVNLEGKVIYLDTTVYSVTLPTGNAWSFVLDPQGLLSLGQGESGTVSSLLGSGNAGKIIVSDYTPTVINNSSVDVTLKVALQVTGNVTAVDKATSINVGTENKVYLTVEPTRSSVASGESTYVGSGRRFAIGNLPDNLKFVLERASYLVHATEKDGEREYSLDMKAGTGNGTQLRLDGRCNKNADWSDFTGGSKKVGVSATFSFARTSDADNEIAPVYGVYGLKADGLAVTAGSGQVDENWTGEEGDLYHYHKSTKGRGVPVIIMPVHFGTEDLVQGGKMQTATTWAAETILNVEIIEDVKEYIDVYIYLETDSVSPVPMTGYVDTFGAKAATARRIAEQDLGLAPEAVRIIYLGNCDEAGQVGGHAYGGSGAMLSWGNNPNTGKPWEPTPDYWALHEFWGHAFGCMADEYPMEPYWTGSDTGRVEAANMYIKKTKPAETEVPWYNFIGYEEGVETIGLYSYNLDSNKNSWRPSNNSFMNGNPSMFVSMYHKWVVYKMTMDYAGFYVTLQDFEDFMDITLPTPPANRTTEDHLKAAALEGGKFQLTSDMTLTSQVIVAGDCTIDLNGHNMSVTVAGGSGIKITGTLTIVDTSETKLGKLTVKNTGEGAAINTKSGSFVMESGTVEAIGGSWSAGIGGGTNESNGTVTIKGGTVTATGGVNGAGIGGGSSGANGGYIYISGGTVTATGNGAAADIGPGAGGSNGVVQITGGTVNATRGQIRPQPPNP